MPRRLVLTLTLLALPLLACACRGGGSSDPGDALGESGHDKAVVEAMSDVEVATAAMGIVRHVLYDEAAPDTAALAALPGRRAYVCAYQDRPTRVCATGVGDDLAGSITAAAETLERDEGRKIDPEERSQIRLKLDVVTEVDRRKFDDEWWDPRARKVAVWGFFVRDDAGEIAYLLPSQVLEIGVHHRKKGFERKNIARHLKRNNHDLAELEGEWSYEVFQTISWVERDQPDRQPPEVFRLYRLHPLELEEPTPEIMLQRMVWAGDYLNSSVTIDGKIRYQYQVDRDRDSRNYNLIRHAGTTYSMLQIYDRTRYEPYLLASKKAIDHLMLHTDRDQREGPYLPADHPRQGDSLYVVGPPRDEAPDGFVELGGAGLGLVMLDQYVEATGDTETYREEALGMARFIVANQRQDGEFDSYPPRYPGGESTRDTASPYYPGEAILGLVRLYSWEGDELWLEAAVRGADWLIDVRDEGKDEKSLANDHWLMLALSYLYLYTEDRRYVDHSIDICRAVEYQYNKNRDAWDEYPDYQGGYYDPPRSTPAATRGEGLGAVLETCRLAGEDCAWIEFLLQETIRHEMMSQYTPDMTFWMEDRAKTFGGWAGGLIDVDIRNDFVQHNMSSLLGYERLLLRREGVELPGGPGWMERRLDGLEFAGISADEMARLRAESLRYRGETYWDTQAAPDAAP